MENEGVVRKEQTSGKLKQC